MVNPEGYWITKLAVQAVPDVSVDQWAVEKWYDRKQSTENYRLRVCRVLPGQSGYTVNAEQEEEYREIAVARELPSGSHCTREQQALRESDPREKLGQDRCDTHLPILPWNARRLNYWLGLSARRTPTVHWATAGRQSVSPSARNCFYSRLKHYSSHIRRKR